jgi:transposase InsO family protein
VWALCPELARREIQDLLRRYRTLWRLRHRLVLRVLHWQRPGSVWAVDFSEPPAPVDGRYAQLLAVRDLATGMQLAWLPVSDATAQTAIGALTALFREHGPPLVLKSDNGSAFVAEETQSLLAAWQVWQLFSPPDCPKYNGACEAGIGSVRTRTHHRAVRRGRPEEWTCDDAEAARLEANQTARPWGRRGPTPDEVWQQRELISSDQRMAFASSVRRMQAEAQAELRTGDGPPDPAALNRAAIARALVAHDLLRFTSERVTPSSPR